MKKKISLMSGKEDMEKNDPNDNMTLDQMLNYIVDSRVKSQRMAENKYSFWVAIITILLQTYIIMVAFNMMVEVGFIKWQPMNYLVAFCVRVISGSLTYRGEK